MKVYVKLPDEDPQLWEIPNDLRSLQHIVGGFIETLTICRDVVLIFNEEGRLLHLPYNCQICGVDLVSPVIFAGIKDDDFSDIKYDDRILRAVFPKLYKGCAHHREATS